MCSLGSSFKIECHLLSVTHPSLVGSHLFCSGDTLSSHLILRFLLNSTETEGEERGGDAHSGDGHEKAWGWRIFWSRWRFRTSTAVTPLALAAGGWEVRLQPGEGECVTDLTLDMSSRESTLAEALAQDIFSLPKILGNQLEACPIQFPCYHLLR